MSPKNWLDLIINSLELVADGVSQERSWREREPINFPGWEELFCVVFDDCLLDDFIDGTFWEATVLTIPQHQRLRDLRTYMNKAGDALDNGAESKLLLDNPDWLEARAIARSLLLTVNGNGGTEDRRGNL